MMSVITEKTGNKQKETSQVKHKAIFDSYNENPITQVDQFMQ